MMGARIGLICASGGSIGGHKKWGVCICKPVAHA